MNAPAPFTAVTPSLAALPFIDKWVFFASVSRDSNLPLLDWTEAYLNGLGISCSRTCDDRGKKANLWATLPAHDGQTKTGGIVLSGHTDVVPVDGRIALHKAGLRPAKRLCAAGPRGQRQLCVDGAP